MRVERAHDRDTTVFLPSCQGYVYFVFYIILPLFLIVGLRWSGMGAS